MDLSRIKSAIGHVVIRYVDTKEVLVDKYNAIHFGNISMAIATALSGSTDGHIRWMAFGNGGTSLNDSGLIDYRVPNVSEFRDESASLYNETYSKDLQVNNDRTYIETVVSNVNFADIRMVATLDFGEPAGQEILDNASSIDGDFVFDEIGLKINDGENSNTSTLISHIIFHPLMKSLNRSIEIEYTIRIQMG